MMHCVLSVGKRINGQQELWLKLGGLIYIPIYVRFNLDGPWCSIPSILYGLMSEKVATYALQPICVAFFCYFSGRLTRPLLATQLLISLRVAVEDETNRDIYCQTVPATPCIAQGQ